MAAAKACGSVNVFVGYFVLVFLFFRRKKSPVYRGTPIKGTAKKQTAQVFLHQGIVIFVFLLELHLSGCFYSPESTIGV